MESNVEFMKKHFRGRNLKTDLGISGEACEMFRDDPRLTPATRSEVHAALLNDPSIPLPKGEHYWRNTLGRLELYSPEREIDASKTALHQGNMRLGKRVIGKADGTVVDLHNGPFFGYSGLVKSWIPARASDELQESHNAVWIDSTGERLRYRPRLEIEALRTALQNETAVQGSRHETYSPGLSTLNRHTVGITLLREIAVVRSKISGKNQFTELLRTLDRLDQQVRVAGLRRMELSEPAIQGEFTQRQLPPLLELPEAFVQNVRSSRNAIIQDAGLHCSSPDLQEELATLARDAELRRECTSDEPKRLQRHTAYGDV